MDASWHIFRPYAHQMSKMVLIRTFDNFLIFFFFTSKRSSVLAYATMHIDVYRCLGGRKKKTPLAIRPTSLKDPEPSSNLQSGHCW